MALTLNELAMEWLQQDGGWKPPLRSGGFQPPTYRVYKLRAISRLPCPPLLIILDPVHEPHLPRQLSDQLAEAGIGLRGRRTKHARRWR